MIRLVLKGRRATNNLVCCCGYSGHYASFGNGRGRAAVCPGCGYGASTEDCESGKVEKCVPRSVKETTHE